LRLTALCKTRRLRLMRLDGTLAGHLVGSAKQVFYGTVRKEMGESGLLLWIALFLWLRIIVW